MQFHLPLPEQYQRSPLGMGEGSSNEKPFSIRRVAPSIAVTTITVDRDEDEVNMNKVFLRFFFVSRYVPRYKL